MLGDDARLINLVYDINVEIFDVYRNLILYNYIMILTKMKF